MESHEAASESGGELIQLVVAPTRVDPAPLIQRFKETVFTEHDFIELEIDPSLAFVHTLAEEFEELTGQLSNMSPLLEMDGKAFDSLEFCGRNLASTLSLDPSFTWDHKAAQERHLAGGIPSTSLGLIALDEWLTTYGFRLLGLNDGSDGYHGLAVALADVERAWSLATAAGIDLYELKDALRAEVSLERLDHVELRNQRFSRRLRGYAPSQVSEHLAQIAERVEQRTPTRGHLILPSKGVHNQSLFATSSGGYSYDEVHQYLEDLVTLCANS